MGSYSTNLLGWCRRRLVHGIIFGSQAHILEQKKRGSRQPKSMGMIPEDYKPYPDDDRQNGDYPELEPYSGYAKDSHLWYTDDQLKKEFWGTDGI